MSIWAYLQIELIPLIALLIVLYISSSRFDPCSNSRRLQILAILVISILVVDSVNWWTVLYPRTVHPSVIWISNILYFLLTEAIAYFWFVYVIYQIYHNSLSEKQKKWMRLSLIPLIIVCIIIILSPWNHMVFYLDPSDFSYHRGQWHLLQVGCGFGYMFTASILAFIKSTRVSLREQKQECLFLCYVVLLPFAGGTIQIININYIFLWPLTAAAVFLIYCDFQGRHISIDALTLLNNRGNFERYLQQKIQGHDTLWYLVMIDANHFKRINDKYGHIEGDRALQIMAQVLRDVFGTNGNYISRYGGDEFVVIVEHSSEEQLRDSIESCKQALAHETVKQNLPYEISISAGYAQFEDNESTPATKLIQLADQRMYGEKGGK